MGKLIAIVSISTIFMLLTFNGCAAKSTDDAYYDRANQASSKALNKLDKE